jgi:hypothetical protein
MLSLHYFLTLQDTQQEYILPYAPWIHQTHFNKRSIHLINYKYLIDKNKGMMPQWHPLQNQQIINARHMNERIQSSLQPCDDFL